MARQEVGTEDYNRDLAAVIAGIGESIDIANLKIPEEYFYASLPLCVIDAVFSIGVTYTATRNTVARWCDAHGWDRLRGNRAQPHTTSEFIALCRAKAPEVLAVQDFGNRQRTSATSGILKAEAVLRFARVLARHGVERLGDMDDTERNVRIEAEIKQIPGQGSGVSFEYFQMLAGSDRFVKADRMICRFVGERIGLTGPASPAEARKLLTDAADKLGVPPRSLDYAVWEHQRSRKAA